MLFGGAGPAESMAGETSQQRQARLQRNRSSVIHPSNININFKNKSFEIHDQHYF
jgi:hypothetical protein